ncbi:MAG: MoxR family ATPase [Acidimicrobiaceae bacterium]|nr:MoxR family ATPase [Acidimicrobiaceae bacterium]
MATQQTAATERVGEFAEVFDAIVANVSEALIGKEPVIRLALMCLVSEGHLLVEDVPGVGKTSLAKALARSLALDWQRIQFTPDLLPSDVTGASVYDRNSGTFTFRPGGVFANIVLADELNRASPKTQAALLEAMEERQVTVDRHTYRLPIPFVVMATQNPIEHEGTYPLPESQLDRFLLRVRMGYPDRGAEITMLDQHATGSSAADLKPVASPEDVLSLVQVVNSVHVAPALKGYIVDLAIATRKHPAFALGMSPRGALALQRASRALAASCSREYVIPDDIKALISPVLEHRVMLSPEAHLGGAEVGDLLEDVVRAVPVPSGRS